MGAKRNNVCNLTDGNIIRASSTKQRLSLCDSDTMLKLLNVLLVVNSALACASSMTQHCKFATVSRVSTIPPLTTCETGVKVSAQGSNMFSCRAMAAEPAEAVGFG